MKITITATVPDGWRDPLYSGELEQSRYDEIVDALINIGGVRVDVEKIEIGS